MTDTGLPHLPGVATVSEILSAVEAEYTELKFLPTQAAGDANYLKSVRFTDLIGTLLADRRNLHHNVAQYLALPNVGLHRFHRGRGSSWPADPGLRGDCRTRRCSNGVVTPRWGYGVLAGAVAGSCVARLLLTSCAAVTVNPRASRQPCRPGIAAAQGGNG